MPVEPCLLLWDHLEQNHLQFFVLLRFCVGLPQNFEFFLLVLRVLLGIEQQPESICQSHCRLHWQQSSKQDQQVLFVLLVLVLLQQHPPQVQH